MTINPKILSLVVGFLVCIILYVQRNRILDLTCTGIFFCSYITFVLVGVLASPWLINNYFKESYPYVLWSLISNNDLVKAIFIISGGMGLVLLGNITLDLIYKSIKPHFKLRWGYLLKTSINFSPGLNLLWLRFISLLCLSITLFMLFTKSDLLIDFYSYMFYNSDVSTYYELRSKVYELGLIYQIMVTSVLPFLAVLHLMIYKNKKNINNFIWSFLMVASTTLLLLTLFQKRPLFVFILCLLFVHGLNKIYSVRWKIKMPKSFPTTADFWFKRFPWIKVMLALFIPFMILIFLYFTSTNIDDTSGSLAQTIVELAMVSFDRIFTRLSIMPIFYAHYFPNIDPHYGVHNIGKIATLLNLEFYPDPVIVFRYFTNLKQGGGAIGSIVDFYSAFGWFGWAFCCYGLGIFLRALDHLLRKMPFTPLNCTFYIFMLVFAYYFSQASFARSLSSYGGLAFFMLKFLLSLRIRPVPST